MFERLGSWTYRFRFLIVAAWIVGGVACAALAPSLAGSGSTDQASFLPSSAPSVQARDELERAFPGSTSASSATITLERAGGLTDADLAFRDAYAAWTMSADAPPELRAAVTGTETADSRPELASMLRSDGGQFELLVVNLDVENAGDAASIVVEQLREHLAATSPGGLETHVTGAAAISSDYLEAVRVGTDSTTAVTVVLVLVILLLIYRAPLAALVPLVTIGSAYAVSRGILGFLAALGWQVSSLLDTFLVVMVFGVGTDYAIFLISRYREEVAGGGDWHDAARTTVKRIGAVITASAATVIVGMTAMAFGEFEMISSTGPAIAVAIGVTLVAGLTLAPAMLSIFGHYLFWPLHSRPRPEGDPGGFFARLASGVSRHPGIVTVGIMVALLVPAAFLPQVRTNFDVLSELPADADSRVGYEAIARYLGEDKLVQSTGLVDAGGGGDMLAPSQLAKLRDLMIRLGDTPGVATVTSIVTPDGDGVVPDGFRPSDQLRAIADEMDGDDGTTGSDSASLLDPEVSDGLDTALAYVNGLGTAFPDVAAGTAMRDLQGGITHAQDIVERVRTNAVLSTQLRTLASSITSPSAAAGSSGEEDGATETLMSDYLAELADAYPEVRSLESWTDGVTAAKSLEKDGSITAALDLADAFNALANHFDGRPDATLSPQSLAGTPSAKELKREAEDTFGALPDQYRALGAVFATRPDDIWIPTTLTGEDADDLRDAIDAFVARDRSATRFYVTNANDPYSGGAFGIVRDAQAVLAGGAPSFGPAATATLGGPTAQFADVQDTLSTDFNRVGIITVIGILVVLVLLLRSIVAPLYLVATVLVSYASAVGLSAFLFQDLMGHPGISFYLPLMVFVLLVALGSDYNIFLMSRIREESEHRPLKDGIRVASGRTGAVITSAGLILAGTFGSMATAPLIVLFQVGVAVAIGVLIDTFIVRSILVPAITTIAGDRAWWPSGAGFADALRRVPLVPAGAGAMTAGMTGGPAARLTRGRLAAALGLVVLVPLTVAGLLTWSLGGSAGDVGAIRAAVVDLDQGGTVPAADGTIETLALGADLEDALTAPAGDGGFTWIATDGPEAADGLRDGRYAAVLTVPADFSRTVAAIRADPTGTAPRATLRLVIDDGSGSALGTVAREVSAAIATATGNRVTASYVDGVLLAVSEAHDILATAADDAGSMAASTTQLADHAAGAEAFAGQLVGGLQEFIDQADDASSGTDELVSGTRKLADGAVELKIGARRLARGVHASADGATALADGAAGISDGLAALDQQTALIPAQAGALADGADGVALGAAGVADGAVQLAGGLALMQAQTTGLGAQGQALADGAADLRAGAVALSDGVDQADAGASSLATGAGQLAAGVAGYADAVASLAAGCAGMGGTPAICAALDDLAAQGVPLVGAAADTAAGAAGVAGATAELSAGAADLQAGATGLRDGTALLAAGLAPLEAGIADSAAGAADLALGAAALSGGASQLSVGTALLADGMPALADGVAQLADGGAGVSTGATRLASGLGDLADGADALTGGAKLSAKGAKALASGTADAVGGLGDLTDSMQAAADAGSLVEAQAKGLADDGTSLADEADALADRLRTSADGTATYSDDTRSRVGTLAADPVAVDATGTSLAGGPGSGLAPFLMALAIWLGALASFLVLPAFWGRDDRRWWRSTMVALAAAATVAVAGSLLMVGGIRFLLGVEVAELGTLVAFAALAALTFTALVQALIALLGSRGWLLALLLLVVQVAAAGIPLGTAAVPGPLAAVGPFLPMSHAIDGFRGAIAGGAGRRRRSTRSCWGRGCWSASCSPSRTRRALGGERRRTSDRRRPAPEPGRRSGQRREERREPLEPGLEHRRLVRVPDAQVALDVESAARRQHHALGLEQADAEVFGRQVRPIAKQRGGARRGADVVDPRFARDPRVEDREVPADDRPVACEQRVLRLERDRGEQVIHLADADHRVVPVAAHRIEHLARRHHPAQAETGQRERLGHAADADRTLVPVDEGRRGPVARLVDAAVDLVRDEPRPGLARDVDDRGQPRLVEQRAGGVVRVDDGDHLRPAGGSPQLVDVRQPALLLAEAHRTDVRTEALRDRGVLLVGGHDRHDHVAGLDQRLVREGVGADGAVRDEHVLGLRRRVQPRDRDPQPARALDRPVVEAHGGEPADQGGHVHPGELQQLLDRDRVHAGLGQVVPAPGLPPVHPDLDAEVADAHRLMMPVVDTRRPATHAPFRREPDPEKVPVLLGAQLVGQASRPAAPRRRSGSPRPWRRRAGARTRRRAPRGGTARVRISSVLTASP